MPLPSPVRPWHGEQYTLKRCSPRLRSVSLIGNGKLSANLPPTLPAYRCSSSFRKPRATVPSTSGCADAPPGSTALASSGSYRGASCMSWRQAVENVSKGRRKKEKGKNAARRRPAVSAFFLFPFSLYEFTLFLNFHHPARLETVQERACLFEIEFRIGRFDHEEEAIRGRMLRKPLRVEDRVIRLRQSVERQHAEDGCAGGEEN